MASLRFGSVEPAQLHVVLSFSGSPFGYIFEDGKKKRAALGPLFWYSARYGDKDRFFSPYASNSSPYAGKFYRRENDIWKGIDNLLHL